MNAVDDQDAERFVDRYSENAVTIIRLFRAGNSDAAISLAENIGWSESVVGLAELVLWLMQAFDTEKPGSGEDILNMLDAAAATAEVTEEHPHRFPVTD